MGVLVPATFRWDATFAEGERRLVLDRILRLPAWARGESSAANLDIKPLRGHGGLYRLRSGRLRAIFQRLGEAIIIHRVDRRGDAYVDHDLDAIRLVRSGDGLRALEPARRTEPATARVAVPSKDRHLPHVRRATLTNPLSIFTDAELRQAGLTAAAIDAARRIPAGIAPDDSDALAAQAPAIRQRVVELWERPKLLLDALQRQPPDEMPALLNLSEEEARRRLSAEDSLTASSRSRPRRPLRRSLTSRSSAGCSTCTRASADPSNGARPVRPASAARRAPARPSSRCTGESARRAPAGNGAADDLRFDAAKGLAWPVCVLGATDRRRPADPHA